MKKKVLFGAELPDEVSAFFCANDAHVLTDVKVDVHFHFNAQSVTTEDELSRIESLEKLLDAMQDETYKPNRFMPQQRVKSTVILLCMNLFMRMWKLENHTLSQYSKVPKSSIAYITGIDVKYVEDLVPSANNAHRFVSMSERQKQALERLLRDISDIELRGTGDLLNE